MLTPPVAYGDSPLWDGAFGMAVRFPAHMQSARFRQRLPPRGSCQSRQALTEGVCPPQRRAFAESGAANAVPGCDPSREKAILENPQIFQNCEIINNSSAEHGQSASGGHFKSSHPARERISKTHDRPAQGSKLHRAVMCKKEDRSLLCRMHRRVARIKESI